MKVGRSKLGLIAGGLAAALGASAASAAPVSFIASSGNLAAQVDFAVSGNNLVVTLSNISMADCLVPADALGAVFWDSKSALNLTPVSGYLNQANGSTAVYGYAVASGDVGGEFAYNGNCQHAPGSEKYGISAVGYSDFGPPNVFPGSLLNPTGGNPPDGPTGCLLSAGDDITTANGGLDGTTKIKNSVVFTLSGLPANFDPSKAFSNIWFQYGTSYSEPGIPGTPTGGGAPPPPAVPLPPAAWAGMSLLGAMGVSRFIQRRRNA